MKKKEKSNQNLIKIGDLAEISLIELITLRTLLRFNEPIVRHSLYLEVSQFLHNTKSEISQEIKDETLSLAERRYYQFLKSRIEKKISLSSFYNSLDNLEKVGFVSFTEKGTRKKNIEKTYLTEPATNLVFQYYIRHGLINDDDYVAEVAQKVLKKINRTDYGVMLTIWLHDYIEFPLINLFTKGAKEFFLLAKEVIYNDFVKLNLDNVNISELYNNNQIREGNDIFDIVLLPNYERKPDFYGMSRIELLKEAYRVCKPGGIIVIAVRDDFLGTENFYTNRLIELYREAITNRIFSKAELEGELNSINFSNIEIMDFKGLLIGIGKK